MQYFRQHIGLNEAHEGNNRNCAEGREIDGQQICPGEPGDEKKRAKF